MKIFLFKFPKKFYTGIRNIENVISKSFLRENRLILEGKNKKILAEYSLISFVGIILIIPECLLEIGPKMAEWEG